MKASALKTFLQRWLINTLAVLVAVKLVNGIRYDSNLDLLVATLVLGILNAFLRPLLLVLSLPLLVFTLGLFTLVINAVLLYFVGNLVTGFHVADFTAALKGAVVISIISFVLNLLTGTGKPRVQVQRGKRTPGNDDGPVIDV
jgi:putative membrane protein